MNNKTFFYSLLALLIVSTLASGCEKEVAMVPETTVPEVPTVQNPTTETVLEINGVRAALDTNTQTFFFSIGEPQTTFSATLEFTNGPTIILLDNRRIENGATVQFANLEDQRFHTLNVTYGNTPPQDYRLVLTNLPVLQIDTNEKEIQNEPKIPAAFRLHAPNTQQENPLITSFIGIEIRGLSSQQYDKKSYGFELWEDTLGKDKLDAALLGMRRDDDWILDAMFVDPARMRNRVTTDIWLDFQQLPYMDVAPKARNGTRGKLVEVLINHDYRGVYMLTERIDRKLLKLEEFDDTENFGLLYKAVDWGAPVTFVRYEPYNPNASRWTGWEQKYPDPSSEGIFWAPLADFVQLVTATDEARFKAEIDSYLNLDNAIDYFLLLNLIQADDNTGKNVYLTKYQQSTPFNFVPWDLDATWGLFWDGSRTFPNKILSNGLFNRLLTDNPADYKQRLKQRWQRARLSIFTQANLMAYFEKYAEQLNRRNAIEREKERWATEQNLTEELLFINQWLEKRLVFLDDYFESL